MELAQQEKEIREVYKKSYIESAQQALEFCEVSATVPQGTRACNEVSNQCFNITRISILKGTQDLLPRVNRNQPKYSCSNRGAHFRLCCLILALLVANLPPTCRNIAPTSTKQRHLGANIAQNSRQDASTTPSNHPKTSKNIEKPMVFQCFLISSASTKMLQKSSQNSAKASQNEPNMAILALTWPILGATCCQLGSNLAHVAPIFAPMSPKKSSKIAPQPPKTPQDAPRPSKTPPDTDFLRFSTPPDFDFHRFFSNFALIF